MILLFFLIVANSLCFHISYGMEVDQKRKIRADLENLSSAELIQQPLENLKITSWRILRKISWGQLCNYEKEEPRKVQRLKKLCNEKS